MGHIKEPKGVDFLIKSEPLTDRDRIEISKFITNYKSNKVNTQTLKTKKTELV